MNLTSHIYSLFDFKFVNATTRRNSVPHSSQGLYQLYYERNNLSMERKKEFTIELEVILMV